MYHKKKLMLDGTRYTSEILYHVTPYLHVASCLHFNKYAFSKQAVRIYTISKKMK